MFQNIPTVTKNLLIINVIVFLACNVFPVLNEPLTGYYFQSAHFKVWQILSHMFMHGNFTHLLMNMFALYMFGGVLEKYWGGIKFINYYVLCGLGAFGLHQFITYLEVQKLIAAIPANLSAEVFANGYSALMEGKNYTNIDAANLNFALNIGLVGASGCVFGLLLAFGMMFPNTELMMLFIPFPIKAKWFVICYGAIELLQAFANREGDNVAHFAHLGGMLFGYIILKIWQTQGKLYS
jgi:membrane associated rhomboid family serine protease